VPRFLRRALPARLCRRGQRRRRGEGGCRRGRGRRREHIAGSIRGRRGRDVGQGRTTHSGHLHSIKALRSLKLRSKDLRGIHGRCPRLLSVHGYLSPQSCTGKQHRLPIAGDIADALAALAWPHKGKFTTVVPRHSAHSSDERAPPHGWFKTICKGTAAARVAAERIVQCTCSSVYRALLTWDSGPLGPNDLTVSTRQEQRFTTCPCPSQGANHEHCSEDVSMEDGGSDGRG
jgi:hypothetical protein